MEEEEGEVLGETGSGRRAAALRRPAGLELGERWRWGRRAGWMRASSFSWWTRIEAILERLRRPRRLESKTVSMMSSGSARWLRVQTTWMQSTMEVQARMAFSLSLKRARATRKR